MISHNKRSKSKSNKKIDYNKAKKKPNIRFSVNFFQKNEYYDCPFIYAAETTKSCLFYFSAFAHSFFLAFPLLTNHSPFSNLPRRLWAITSHTSDTDHKEKRGTLVALWGVWDPTLSTENIS